MDTIFMFIHHRLYYYLERVENVFHNMKHVLYYYKI
jgi:hypothetical protein